MTASKHTTDIVVEKDEIAAALEIKFDEVQAMLRTLHTLTVEMTPDGVDENFRSSEALWCCAAQMSRQCSLILDDCARLIGGTPMGTFAEEECEGAAKGKR